MDFGGGDDFPAMLRLSIAKSDMYILAYNTFELQSIEIARRMRDEIWSVKGKNPEIPVILLRTKSDLPSAVSDEQKTENDSSLLIADLEKHCSNHLLISSKAEMNILRLTDLLALHANELHMKGVSLKRQLSASFSLKDIK